MQGIVINLIYEKQPQQTTRSHFAFFVKRNYIPTLMFSNWYIAIAAIFGLKSDKIQYIIIPRKRKKFVDVSDDHYNFSFDIFSRYEETCKKCGLLHHRTVPTVPKARTNLACETSTEPRARRCSQRWYYGLRSVPWSHMTTL